MILEVATFEIKAGSEDTFEQGVRQAAPLFRDAQGCHTMKVRRSIERPAVYMLFVEWETLEDHTERFRSSHAFAEWRRLVGACFAATPDVQHFELAVDNF